VFNPNHIGAIGEAAIACEAIRAGLEVFKPLSEHSRADLVFGTGTRLFRIQCKSARKTREILCINLVSSWHTPAGYVRHKYSADEVDFIAAHCMELNAPAIWCRSSW
jgi:hypothetical protein